MSAEKQSSGVGGGGELCRRALRLVSQLKGRSDLWAQLSDNRFFNLQRKMSCEERKTHIANLSLLGQTLTQTVFVHSVSLCGHVLRAVSG